ncbi:MAG: M23 family metallopeptidase [Hungatella sp.]
MKEKFNQLFKDKLFLVMFVLGLLTIVAAAGVITIQRGNSSKEQTPYMQIQEPGNSVTGETRVEPPVSVAGRSDATKASDEPIDVPETEALVKSEMEESIAPVGSGKEAAVPLVLNFGETSKMTWPIYGNIVLDYSMDSTIYFPTLDQYQCNEGLVIQGEVSNPVLAPANAKVVSVGINEEIGNYVILDLGNDYLATCGQLKEVQVVADEYLKEGQILGYVAEPTKYYSVEGSNVFFELQHQEKAIDPLDYLQ